jgi:hypothetical protein
MLFSELIGVSFIQREDLRIYRESVEKFEREYSAALRALPGPKKKDLLVCPYTFYSIVYRSINRKAFIRMDCSFT